MVRAFCYRQKVGHSVPMSLAIYYIHQTIRMLNVVYDKMIGWFVRRERTVETN